MRCVILSLSLCAVTLAASEEPWRKPLDRLFNNTKSTEEVNVDLSPSTRKDDSISCTQEDGSIGECVVYYQCDAESKNLITDGTTLIDIRFSEERPCVQYLHVCCGHEQLNRTRVEVPAETSGRCGFSDPGASGQAFRVSNKDVAEFAEYPWMLAVLKKALDNGIFTPKNYVGGATLIHARAALTAAHKVQGLKPEELKLRAGEWDTQTAEEIYPYQERDIAKIIVHGDFYAPSVLNSVALLIAAEPFSLAPHVGVACVGRAVPAPGTSCFSMGWGKEDFGAVDKYAVVLKKVAVPIVSREKCQTRLRGTRLGNHFVLHRSFACAGGEPGVDVCRGDGGSPLVCPISEDGTRFAVVGTVAWGIGCGEEGVPGVYTDVTGFRDWIEERMKGEGFDTKGFDYTA